MSSSCVSSEWWQLVSHSGAEMGVKSPSLEGSRGLFLPETEPTDGGPSTILGFVSICIVALHIGHSRREGHYRPSYLRQGLPTTLKAETRMCAFGELSTPSIHIHQVSMGSRHSWQEHQHMSSCRLCEFYSLTKSSFKTNGKSWLSGHLAYNFTMPPKGCGSSIHSPRKLL